MHILYDHQIFSIQKFGGISRIFIELMRELTSYQNCHISWYRGAHIDGYEISDFKNLLNKFWRTPLFVNKISKKNINNLLFYFFCRLNNETYDLYHPTYYDPSLLKTVKTKRLVITICDMIPEIFLSNRKRFPQFQRLLHGKKYLAESADLIFTISENTKNELCNILNISSDKIIATPLASRISKINSIENIPEFVEKPFFLYVGTRSKYKNFSLLMQTFNSSKWLKPNFNLTCFGGSGDFSLFKNEADFIKENNLGDTFIYLDGDDNLLKALYENAQALVYTSRYEGFGLPLLEAMECGCPVICCRHSSIPEVVGDSALFFDPDSTEELEKCMRKVVEDTSQRSKLIQAGLERAKQFSWRKTASLTMEGYKSIL